MGKPVLTEQIVLTQTQLEVINGALLGDGNLFLHKNGINAQFSYTSKTKAHVEYVYNFFTKYISGEGLKFYTYFDTRSQKEYSRYSFRTYTNSTFTILYHKWYVNKIKHIPQDLILTPLTCLVWYIGDGGICSSQYSEYIKLSTHCFSKEDQENILIPQLSQFEASLQKADLDKNGNQQYFIYIPHRKERQFLTYIGDCPFSEYQYKWIIKEYHNTIPQNHTDKEVIFCNLYNQGLTYYQIAKQFSIEPNAVKYYLVKNGIYQKDKIRNIVIQYKDNVPINIFSSGTEASKYIGLSPSMISSVCNGHRASGGGYQWKKYSGLSQNEKDNIQQLFSSYFDSL